MPTVIDYKLSWTQTPDHNQAPIKFQLLAINCQNSQRKIESKFKLNILHSPSSEGYGSAEEMDLRFE